MQLKSSLIVSFAVLGLSSAIRAEEMPAIFNGKNLDGWVAEGKTEYQADGKTLPTWTVEDGMMRFSDAGKMGFLRYDKELTDFAFHAEFRLMKAKAKANSGIGVRTRPFDLSSVEKSRATRASLYSYEIQLYDDAGKAPDKHCSGSLYRYVAPRENAIKPPLEWNTIDVECVGPKIKVTMNGKPVIDVDQSTIPEIKDKPLRGYLAIQSHGGQVEFRDLRLKEIK